MNTIALRQFPGSALIMLASTIALCLTFIAWSMWMRSDADMASLTSWSDVTWQIAQVDSRGRLVRLGSHPFALATLFGLVTLGFVSFGFGAWQFFAGDTAGSKKEDDALSERLEKVGKELDDEVF